MTILYEVRTMLPIDNDDLAFLPTKVTAAYAGDHDLSVDISLELDQEAIQAKKEAKEKAEAEAKAKAEQEAKEKAEAEAKAKAKAEEDARIKAEEEAKAKAEAEAAAEKKRREEEAAAAAAAAAAAEAQESPDSSAQANERTVYITNTGEKYHAPGCRYLKKSQIPIALDDAIARGYEPCKVCGGGA